MFPKNSAFRQNEEKIARARAAAELPPLPSPHVGEHPEPKDDGPPFEHWHHELMTIDTLLDQHPPELRRARELLLEVADEIHSQFERVR